MSSTEKSTLLDRLAGDYNKRGAVGDLCPLVSVVGLTSGTAEQALEKGWTAAGELTQDKPAPDVWTPTTSMWVALLWDKKPGLVQPPRPAGDPYPVVARSPIVVAMPTEKAAALTQALEEDKKKFDWDALQLSTSDTNVPQNWGAPNTALRRGKPEWGRFWFRKDNPLTSTSGLAATIATYKVANSLIDGRGPDQVSDLPPEAFGNEKLTKFVRRVEAGIPPSGYSYDATQMMKDLASEDLRMPGGGWSDTSAVVVQEQFVYLYNANRLPYTPNEKAPDRAPVQPLVPLYPASGTLMMDHPYVQMAGLDGDKKSIAEDFLAYLQSSERRQDFSDQGFRDVNGFLLPGLKEQLHGRALETPIRMPTPTAGAGIRAIQDSWRTLGKRARVLLLMDDSGTMNGPGPGGVSRLKAAQEAAAAAVGASLNPDDKVELRRFPGDGSAPYSTAYPLGDVGDKTGILAAIRARDQATGALTPLYDNILDAYRDTKEHLNKEQINAIIVLTDGTENNTGAAVSSVLGELDGGDVRIYCIAFGSETASLVDLRAIAEKTGGHLFDATTAGDTTLTKAFAQALSVA